MSPRSGLEQAVLDCPPHMAKKQHVNSWRWKKDQLWAEELLSCWVPQEQLIKETKGHVLSTLCFQQLFQFPQFQPRQQPEMQKMQNWTYSPFALMPNTVCPKETGSSKHPAAAPGSCP